MLIRPEEPSDFLAIHQLVETAFRTARVSSGDEQNFVLRLRRSANYIPELALVATEDGELIGHIMLTRSAIETPAGERPALVLAPLAVAAKRRRQGFGGQLVREAILRAKNLGHDAVLLVGDPAYYERFGFRGSLEFGVRNRDGIPDRNVMACELEEGGLNDMAGTVSFPT